MQRLCMNEQIEGGIIVQFYENYLRLCAKEGKSPSAVAVEIGIQKSTITRWVKGSMPRYATLLRVADYFGVTIGDLVGVTPDNVYEVAKEIGIAPGLLLPNERVAEQPKPQVKAVEEEVKQKEEKPIDTGLETALEALRNQPGRRALLSATKNMTEAQALRLADWLSDFIGSDKD